MGACNPFPFNCLRTLSIAMGVCTPSFTESVSEGREFEGLPISWGGDTGYSGQRRNTVFPICSLSLRLSGQSSKKP
jgi:hypothetical protein